MPPPPPPMPNRKTSPCQIGLIQVNEIEIFFSIIEYNKDKLWISDGPHSTLWWWRSGFQNRFYFVSSWNILRIHFTADGYRTFSGFHIKFEKTSASGKKLFVTFTNDQFNQNLVGVSGIFLSSHM